MQTPKTPHECVQMYFDESADLALASETLAHEAMHTLEAEGEFFHATTLIQRWEEYQEELHVLYEQAKEEFGL